MERRLAVERGSNKSKKEHSYVVAYDLLTHQTKRTDGNVHTGHYTPVRNKNALNAINTLFLLPPGILNGRRGAFREAISCYNRALELSHNSSSKHVTLANRSAAFIKSQKFADALEDAQEAASLCPDYSMYVPIVRASFVLIALGGTKVECV